VKRIASILLLGILLFNCAGYRLYTAYMESKANTDLEAQLDDNNYDQSQLISIKIPASHLYYYTCTKQFERVDGQVEIKGVPFKYVKRRLYNDSLEFICIPNQQAIKLITAKNEYFKLQNGLQSNGQEKKAGSHPGISKNFTTDYYTSQDPFKLNDLDFISLKRSQRSFSILSAGILFTVEQPPELAA
jgi:hypothetical protein